MAECSPSDMVGMLEESDSTDIRVRADDLVYVGCYWIDGPEGDPHPAAIFEDTKNSSFIAAVWWWEGRWLTSMLDVAAIADAQHCGALLDGDEE